MNTEQIKAVTAATDGYVLLPAGDGLPECLTNTDGLTRGAGAGAGITPSVSKHR
ncbi:hypothetical protein ALON55S_01026 [Alishewanella longhuensis]